jgi:hypothetical protein
MEGKPRRIIFPPVRPSPQGALCSNLQRIRPPNEHYFGADSFGMSPADRRYIFCRQTSSLLQDNARHLSFALRPCADHSWCRNLGVALTNAGDQRQHTRNNCANRGTVDGGGVLLVENRLLRDALADKENDLEIVGACGFPALCLEQLVRAAADVIIIDSFTYNPAGGFLRRLRDEGQACRD